jgi:uncharacterized Rmd1/YagE family protein
VSIFWGVTEEGCQHILKHTARSSLICPLDADEVELDNYFVIYAPIQRSKIANDQIMIPIGFRDDWSVKLAIAHALAQSSKLCLYEARMGDLVNDTKDMPDHLAKAGKVWPSITPLIEVQRKAMCALLVSQRQTSAVRTCIGCMFRDMLRD